MSVATDLFELQDLELSCTRMREELANMPQIAELAKKRRAHQKLKADATKLFAARKDEETFIADLDAEAQQSEERLAAVRRNTDMSDYRDIQELELAMSDHAKKLDKVAFDRAAHEKKLAELREKENYLASYIKKFEDALIADAKAARDAAEGLQNDINESERRIERISARLPQDVLQGYRTASKRFGGLAVERLEGSVPSICRMALQESSMAELRRADGIAECPYCHRMLVLDGE